MRPLSDKFLRPEDYDKPEELQREDHPHRHDFLRGFLTGFVLWAMVSIVVVAVLLAGRG